VGIGLRVAGERREQCGGGKAEARVGEWKGVHNGGGGRREGGTLEMAAGDEDEPRESCQPGSPPASPATHPAPPRLTRC